MFKISFILLFFWLCFLVPDVLKAQPNLDSYITIAQQQNQEIAGQNFQLTKSLFALKEAKALFLPTVTVQGNYTLAGGGRTIEVPIGDLLNNAYKTLNQLTGSSNFPQVQNQHILLNPNNFYDAKLHTAYPIFNAELQYNRKIKSQQYDLQKTEIDLYRRELVKDVKTAYFSYLQADAAVHIYETALTLVNENLRINTSLFKNDKVNRTAVIRAGNEVSKYTAQLEAAVQNRQTAKAYFNFLLNRDLESAVAIDSIRSLPDANRLSDTTVDKREELSKLKQAAAINRNAIGLAGTYKIPKLSSFADIGSQDYRFMVNDKSLYYFAGISLEWSLFSGRRYRYKQQQAEEDAEIIRTQTSQAEQRLKLQLLTAMNAYRAAMAQYTAAQLQVSTATTYYSDELKLYKEGQLLFIELLDAQNQLITARLQANIFLFDTWIKAADIERANAGFHLQ